MPNTIKRRYPVGSEIIPKKGVHFRVWAPDHKKVELVLEHENVPLFFNMEKEEEGYFSILVPEAVAGTRYRFKMNDMLHSDPASRYQPFGTSGPSEVVDPSYNWTDDIWLGCSPYGQILYEMHIGTYTQEGTFAAATNKLNELQQLGITVIEIMPINAFPGHFGWGYDGVNLFAPTQLYGSPNDVKGFIDKAHSLGIGVILDVVYNHIGVEDNHLIHFAKEYLSEKFVTDWGNAVNFDCEQSAEFFLTNAKYWIEEYHFDGLRIDATPAIFCSTEEHILAKLTKVIKAAGGKRKTIVVGENEQQNTTLLDGYQDGGYGFDMLWNDDFHHSAYVRLTGKREAYYIDYKGSPQEFISSLKYGFLYQGQYYEWQKKKRGKLNLEIKPESMMVFLENHDQVANTDYGQRLHQKTDPGNYRALTTLMLLSPNTPLIFQGQEFNSDKPFNYFADHSSELSQLIIKGRKKELAQFPRLATSEIQNVLIDPSSLMTFLKCKLDHGAKDEKIYAMFKDLIDLRKNDPVFKNMHKCKIDGAVLGDDSFLIRYFDAKNGDRLLIVNFGLDQYLRPAPEPLLVPDGDKFEVLWSSEAVKYGGGGTPPINIPHWKLPGHSAIVLRAKGKRKENTL